MTSNVTDQAADARQYAVYIAEMLPRFNPGCLTNPIEIRREMAARVLRDAQIAASASGFIPAMDVLHGFGGLASHGALLDELLPLYCKSYRIRIPPTTTEPPAHPR